MDLILPIPLPKVPRSEELPLNILPRDRPPPKPPDQLINKQAIGDTKMDIEENSHKDGHRREFTISRKYNIRNL